MRLYKNWFVHNMFGHPLMQIFEMLGWKNWSKGVHDGTLPVKSNSTVKEK